MPDNNTPDLSGIMQTLMQNPELMSTIMGSIGTAGKANANPENDNKSPEKPAVAPPHHYKQTDHSKLLSALKPYLGETRKDSVDTVIKLLSALELAQASGLLSFKHDGGTA